MAETKHDTPPMMDREAATIAMKLKPWAAPNFAQLEMPPGLKQDGFKELPSVAVADLPVTALDALAKQWLDELYAKAKKSNDWTLGRIGGPKP